MSKFVDKLQRLSKTSTSPIGFGSSVSESKGPRMLLIAALSRLDDKEADVITNGSVDAGLILNHDFSVKVVRQMVEAAAEVPVGVLMKDAAEEKVNELAGSGCDFVVFSTKMPATTLYEEGIGKFLVVEPRLDSGLVKAINNLDVDGVFLSHGEESFLTVEYLLVCQRFSELLDKPFMVILPSLVNSSVLSDLWEVGVSGITISAEQPSEAFVELRKLIEDLPKEARRKRAKSGVILPHYGGGIPVEEEEEEEET